MVEKLSIEQPEFWANLLGAVVNTNIACIPDSVADQLVEESDEERRRGLRDHVAKAKKK